jgi:predicted enzyme related to lactoylglutathione lyase
MADTKPQSGEFCWNELVTGDVSKAKNFYSNMFGWQYQENQMQDMTYTMITAGDKMIGGVLSIPKGQEGMIPPHWMGYIQVKNLDESVTKAQSLGATVIKPQTTAGEFGKFAIIQDPTGAYVSLWETFNQ